MRFLARRCVASTSAPPPGRCRRMRPRRRRSAFSFFAQRRCSAGGGTGSGGRTHSSMIVPARRSPRRASSPAASAPPFEWRNGHFSIGARVSGLAVAQSAFHQPWKLIGKWCGRWMRAIGPASRRAASNSAKKRPFGRAVEALHDQPALVVDAARPRGEHRLAGRHIGTEVAPER
jgi:hypothetical protein